MDPIRYMETRHEKKGTVKGPTRVPLALQKVFLTSNSGKEVEEVPAGNVASKTFLRKNKVKKSKHYIPKVTWLFKSTPRRKSDGKKLLNDTSDASASAHTKLTVSESELFTTVPDNIKFKKQDEVSEVPTSDGQSQMNPRSALPPQDYLDRLLSSRGYPTRPIMTLKSGYYATPTRLQQASYHDHLVGLARCGRNNRLKEIMGCGISSNPCNTFGESLIHTVCRRCQPETLQILLDAGATVQVSDDFGRTPLHDACWRAEPCFGIIELIASKDLHLFHMADCRGMLPLSYIPKKQWGEWNKFLESKKDSWWHLDKPPRSSSVSHLAPNSQPIQDPRNALHPEIAAMVSAGKLKPKDAINLNMDKEFFNLRDSPREGSSDVSSVSESSEGEGSFSEAGDDLEDILNLVGSDGRIITI